MRISFVNFLNGVMVDEFLVSLQDVTIRNTLQSSFPNLNFEIRRGEHWLFTGENEALKNALLDAIAGKATMIYGKAEFPFFDQYINAHRPGDPLITRQMLVAHVAPRYHFLNLSNTSQFYYQQRFNSADSKNAPTVLQYLANIIAPIKSGGWNIAETIKKLKLEPLLNEQLIKLSNGETRRLLIAAALLKHPLMLIFTNPFSGLDAAYRTAIAELINQVALSGVSVVMSASPKEIPAAITHIASFHQDHIIETSRRKDFHAKALRIETVDIDAVEVQALLNMKAMPEFIDVVKMKDVSIRYDDKLILNQVNWIVKQGERWVLSGHNGAGKSTLLSLINGDNPQAFANDIILFDRKKGSGESIWDIKRKIGFFSPELYQYFPLETSCLQAVECGFYDTIGLFRPSNPQLVAIALRWMKLLGVEHLKNKLLRQVPDAEQRLCLLARAFVKAPTLLILDEPCQGFDERSQQNFSALLNSICANSNTTLIYVSHYKEDIPESVTKELKLQNGKQVQ